MSGNFATTVVCDFEYEIADGELPNVLCMVAYVLDENLRHVRTIRMWRGDFGAAPPFDTGPDTLFVAYSAWAEMTCFLTLGWKFPQHIFDQHTAYLAATNVLLPYNPDELRKRPRKRLSDACRSYGIEGWENIDKEEIARASAKDVGKNTGRSVSSNTAKRTCGRQRRCYAGNYVTTMGCRAPMSSACCIGPTTAPRRSREYRPAVCRSMWNSGTSYRRTRRR
jgi:hypothetical protein